MLSAMATRRCPTCGLINPAAAVVCDCGWSFVEQEMTDAGCPERAAEYAVSPGVLIGTGLLLILVGVIVTGVTYGAAVGAGGGTYLLAYGPIVAGSISLVKGIARAR